MKKLIKILTVLLCLVMIGTVFTVAASVSTSEEDADGSARIQMMPIGPHIRAYSVMTRGYWIIAPCDFTILGLRVPLDASSSIYQSAAVMRMKYPPSTWTWPTLTYNFDLLGLWQRVPSYSMIPANIPIVQGECILIIGCRDTTSVNSYGVPQYNTMIGSYSVTLNRGGFQGNLFSQSPTGFWSRPSGNIGRVEMYYDFTAGIETDVRLEPQSLNLDSMGNYVCVKVEGFPENPEYSPLDVDGTSVEVEGIGVDLKYGTWNNNRWIAKADRLLVEDSIGAPADVVEVIFRGTLNDGTPFIGKAIIKAL